MVVDRSVGGRNGGEWNGLTVVESDLNLLLLRLLLWLHLMRLLLMLLLLLGEDSACDGIRIRKSSHVLMLLMHLVLDRLNRCPWWQTHLWEEARLLILPIILRGGMVDCLCLHLLFHLLIIQLLIAIVCCNYRRHH